MRSAWFRAFVLALSLLAAGLVSPSAVAAPNDEPGPTASLMNRCQKAGLVGARGEPFYVICVDAFRDMAGVVTLGCDGKADEHGATSCEPVGDVVRVRRTFVVYVWHPAATRARVALGGPAGSASPVYVPLGIESLGPAAFGAAAGEEPPRSVWTFGARKPGAAALNVTIVQQLKADEPARDLFSVEQTYVVEPVYRAALRIGVGFSWMPWARRVGLANALDGHKLPVVLPGARRGLFSIELVAGASYFFCEMPEHALKVCAAAGVRLGVLSLQGAEIKPLNSLMIGPELAIGPDFTLGVFGGIHRHDVPIGEYGPGAVLPPNTSLPTEFRLTPAFSVVVNFTPAFLKGAGVVK